MAEWQAKSPLTEDRKTSGQPPDHKMDCGGSSAGAKSKGRP